MAIETDKDKRGSSTISQADAPEEIQSLEEFSISTHTILEEAARSLDDQVERLSAHEFSLSGEALPNSFRSNYDPSLELRAETSEAWNTLVSPLSFDQWEDIVTSCQERLREVANFEPRHASTVQRAINSLDDCLRFICAEDLDGAESALLMATNSFRSIRAMTQYESQLDQDPSEKFANRTLHRALREFERAIDSMKDYLTAPEEKRDPATLWGMWNALSDGVMIIHAAQRMHQESPSPIPRFTLVKDNTSGRKAG